MEGSIIKLAAYYQEQGRRDLGSPYRQIKKILKTEQANSLMYGREERKKRPENATTF